MGTSDPKTVSLASAIRGRVRRMVASSEQLSLAYLRLARSMSTRGFNPPLSGSWEEQEQRWRNQGKPGSSDSPSTYIDFGVEDSNLFSEVLSFLPSDARILEIGCNAGRNLDYLFRAGYTNLWGIEIGSAAVEMFEATFPETRGSTQLICGDALEEITNLPSSHFDLVFTRGVLVNIHPKDNTFFSEICRVTRAFVLTDESEGSWTAWPRDFSQLFGQLGLEEISCRYESTVQPGQNAVLRVPVVRLFEKIDATPE